MLLLCPIDGMKKKDAMYCAQGRTAGKYGYQHTSNSGVHAYNHNQSLNKEPVNETRLGVAGP